MSIGTEKFVVHICYGGAFEIVNNVPTYLPIDCFRIPLKLPVYTEKPMNRRILLKNVLKKLGWPPKSPVCMKYKFDRYIFDITDDDENFQEFLGYAINNAPIEIYVVAKSNYGSSSGSNPSQTHEVGHQSQYQPTTQPQLTYHEPITQTKIHEPQTYTKIHEPQTDTKNHEPSPHDWEHFDMAHNGQENIFKEKIFECAFEPVVDLNDSDENNGEDEDGDEEDEEGDIFWNMPPLLGENEPRIKQDPVCTYERSHLIKVGKTFSNKAEFLRQLGTKCLEENFQIQLVKSDKSRYTAKCTLPDCEWKCSAYRLSGSDNFIIRKLHDLHTCSRTQIMGNNKHATKKVLGHLLMNSMKLENRVYRGREIQADINNRYGVSISYNQAWRAKCYAIQLLRGSMDDSFRILPLYFHNLKLHNPGSMTNILTDNDSRFKMCYMSIGAVIRTFVQNIRPIIIVDGAHLKDGYLGTNLVAVAMDGNNGILPLAYAIGDGETTEVWTWFLGNLRDHLQTCGIGEGVSALTFISDRAPAIANGISTVFPESFHAICARHLFMNLKVQSTRMKIFEWHYWMMVKAYRDSDFAEHLDVFRRRLFASYNVLRDVGFNRWSRNKSDHVRYAYLTSNSVESINALTKHARKLPITMLLEFFRQSIQQWFFKHRNTGNALTALVTPYAEHKIEKRMNNSRRWSVHPSTNTIIEVRDGGKHGLVNLSDRTCTCMQWQKSGIPCGHVIATARQFGVEDVSSHVERWFTAQTYRATYAEHILPLPHRSEWADPGNLQVVLPPPALTKRQPGRPPGRARIPSQGEEEKKSVKVCSRCHQPGHNRATCRANFDVKGEGTSKSRSKSKVKSDPSEASQSQSLHLSHP